MATALATTAAPVQFDFQNNNVEVMTLDTLRRTHKENDIYGNPLKGIYHYEVIERMAELQYKRGMISRLKYEEAQDTYTTAQETAENARTDLLTAYNNYEWAKRGVMSSAN